MTNLEADLAAIHIASILPKNISLVITNKSIDYNVYSGGGGLNVFENIGDAVSFLDLVITKED